MKIPKNNPLYKKHKRGHRGYPLATIIYYGPNNKKATKVVVAIFYTKHHEDPDVMKKWLCSDPDIRINVTVNKEVLSYLKEKKAKTVILADRILGCIHEEGLDYPEGEECPICTFWRGKDRFSDVDNPPFLP